MFEQVAELFIKNIRLQLEKTYPSKGYNGQRKQGSGNKIVTGNLYNNIDYRIFNDENGLPDSISIIMEDYYYWVDRGRRPGKFPPVRAIKEWILRRPVTFRPIDGKIPSADTQAFLIGRSIAQKGIYKTSFLNKARAAALDDAIELMGEEYAEQLEEILFERIRTISGDQIDLIE